MDEIRFQLGLYAQEIFTPVKAHKKEISMKHKLAGTAIAIGLLAACVSAQSIGQATGFIDGVVFTVDANGGHAVLPTARISLDGPTHIEAESDGAGKFAFNAVPPGAYTINAQAPGLVANRSIEVTAGSTSEIALEMKVQAVVESTTVTANIDQIDTKESWNQHDRRISDQEHAKFG